MKIKFEENNISNALKYPFYNDYYKDIVYKFQDYYWMTDEDIANAIIGDIVCIEDNDMIGRNKFPHWLKHRFNKKYSIRTIKLIGKRIRNELDLYFEQEIIEMIKNKIKEKYEDKI